MSENRKPIILCVDDEPQVIEGLGLHLRKRFEVVGRTSGAEGLLFLEQTPNVAVILSDMRMPNMDGAAFLTKARAIAPDATRMLLTGHAGLDSAIAAVNEGQIFRFLVKPCPPPQLLASAEAAAEQHRLVMAERVLLEQTLRGSIRTMTEMLSFANPAAFGRATRVRRMVCELADRVKARGRWQIEVAAMLSQIAVMTLPPEIAERVHGGQELCERDQALVAKLPAITEQLLGHIPRLESVRSILALAAKTSSQEAATPIERGARLLRLALDFDALEASGSKGADALAILRGRGTLYDADALAALAQLIGQEGTHHEVRELRLNALTIGMVSAEDIVMANGALFVARGHEITEEFLLRAKNFRPGTIREPFRMLVQHRSGQNNERGADLLQAGPATGFST